MINFIQLALAVETPKEEDLRNAKDVGHYITLLYNFGIPIGTTLAVLVIIYAGYIYATSGGTPEKLTQAKDLIVGALVGLALIILAGVILKNIIGVSY